METNWRVTCFRPTKQGVVCTKNSVSFAAESVADKECGVVLYDKEGNCYRFPFQKEGRRGNLYGLKGRGLIIVFIIITWETGLLQTLMPGKFRDWKHGERKEGGKPRDFWENGILTGRGTSL